ncbi:MAG: PstS family phosphate ABC transporter substrate-binding protein [Anaerolineae bacterium]
MILRIDRRHFILGLLLALVLMLGVPACRPGGAPSQQTPGVESELQGTVRVSGAWALYPMMVRWGEEFQKIHPRVRLDISAGGAGKGMADALARLVDIGMVSREVRPEEIEQGAYFVPVAKDAVFPTTNESNPAWEVLGEQGIQRQTFIDLWINGNTLTWGEIAGTESNDVVNVYTRSDACGAAETWAKYLGGAQEDLAGIGVYGDPGLAQAVKTDSLGMGYNNLNYAYDATTGLPVVGLRVIPIDVNEDGEVGPEENLSTKTRAIEAIGSGVYPSPPARDLYLVTQGGFQGLAEEFVRWILTEGQQYAEEVGYISLTDAQLREALGKLGN